MPGPASDVLNTQEVLEVIEQGASSIRSTQQALEAFGVQPSIFARMTQIVLEVKQGLTIACPIGGGAANVGIFYSATLVVFGGVPPYSFTLISGSLPPGLSLNSTTGVISGTPTTAGTFIYTIHVTDSNGLPATTDGGCTIVVSGSAGAPKIFHTTCVQNVSTGGVLTDTPYIVRSYQFNNEKFPPDIIYMTPWSDLGYVFDKISRNLVLDIDTGNVPCTIQLQADGATMQMFTVTTSSNDRDRTIATDSNLEGRLWRLTFAPGTGGKAQVFSAGLDYVNDTNSVSYLDTYWQSFGWTGWSAIKQAWIVYQGGPISINFLTDGDANFYTNVLPLASTRILSRFYLPAISGGILNKSKLHRIQVTGVSGADFRLYAGSLLEIINFGTDQRTSFNLVNVTSEMQLQVAQMNTGAWPLSAP